MKKIVSVINDLKGNGAERVVITLSESFVSLGHSATIVCFNDFVELPINDHVNVVYFNINRWRWIPRFLRGKIVSFFLDRFILKNVPAPDLILSNLLPIDRIMCDSKLSNVHLVIHNTISDEYASSFNGDKEIKNHELLAIYSKKPVTCVSQGVLDDFRNVFPTHTSFNQIYNPINVDLLVQCANNCEVAYDNYIVHVGKFKREKRHDILIRAYAASNTDKLLVLVGQGPLEQEYRVLVEELNLTHKVIFAGFHANPYPLIKQADLLVLSSDFEGLGMVLLEALALHTPAISSDCRSGPSEILPEENLFPPRDIDRLAALLSIPDYSIYAVDFPQQFSAHNIAERYLNVL
jgi:glycosyltransferase involved in cell wall biosynthesis